MVAEEEVIVSKAASEALGIKEMCDNEVKEANEKLDAAVAEVKKLKKAHIDEVRSLKTPPAAAVTILGGMCYLL
jgi:dynein heavy chain